MRNSKQRRQQPQRRNPSLTFKSLFKKHEQKKAQRLARWRRLFAEPLEDRRMLAATFIGIGDLPGGAEYSEVYSISADGNVVVGTSDSTSGREAFRWESDLIQGLGDLPGGTFESVAHATSQDGSVVVGYSKDGPFWHPFRWEGGVLAALQPVDVNDDTYATDVSSDGTIITGTGESSDAGWRRGVRWVGDTNVRQIPGVSGSTVANVGAASADGSRATGNSDGGGNPTRFEPTIWEPDTATAFKLGTPKQGRDAIAAGISADGLVIVGSSQPSDPEAFYWTEGTGFVLMGDFPGGAFSSDAHDASANGSIIVGSGTSDLGSNAFVWDAANGMRDLQALLQENYGLDLSGWRLESAEAISDDGTTIAGNGVNPDGNREGWIASADVSFDQTPGSIGDFVWNDLNHNGIQDAAEPGIEGVTVNLRDFSGVLIDTTSTAPDGSYSFTGLAGADVESNVGYVYWTDFNAQKIQRAKLDGSNVEDVMSPGVGVGVGSAHDIVIDSVNGKMYWADDGGDTIRRANLDGSSSEVIVGSGLQNPKAVALDASGVWSAGIGKMYFTDTDTHLIKRANLDGSNVEEVLNAGVFGGFGIQLDLSAGNMYWTDAATGRILRAALDGTNVEDVVVGLGGVEGIALDVSAGYIYWVDTSNDRLQRSTLDGANVSELVVGTTGARWLELDVAAAKLYWGDLDSQTVQRADLDGDNVETIVPAGFGVPRGIALSLSATGTYFVEFELPAGYEFTTQEQGSDDALDSDADPVTGRTNLIQLAPGETNLTIDAGLIGTGSIHGEKFDDLDGDGVRDPGEPGLDGWTIELVDAETEQVVDTQVTMTMNGEAGWYWFDDVIPGDYIVREVQQPGWQQTFPGSDIIGTTGQVVQTYFQPGRDARLEFGDDIAVLGDNVLIGARLGGGEGSVHYFDGTTGQQIVQFQADPHAVAEEFGKAVATVNNNLVVGAWRYQSRGAALVYDSTTFELLADLRKPEANTGGTLGHRVEAVGDNILVSAYSDTTSGVDSGAVYLFDGNTFEHIRTFVSPNPAADDRFGWSIASNASQVIVGAPRDDRTGTDDGAVYVFNLDGTLALTIENPDPSVSGFFGRSVAAVGGNIAVGASADQSGASGDTGAAYLFDGETGALIHAFHESVALSPGDQFGFEVAAAGANVFVGAPFDDTSQADSGAVYLFDGSSGELLATIVNPDPGVDDRFGRSIARIGSDVLVSSPLDDTGGTDTGTVYRIGGVATQFGIHTVSVLSGETIENIDFANHDVRGSIHGQKFNDLDGDGTRDAGEPGLDGWTIELVDAATGEVVDTQVTMSIAGALLGGNQAGRFFSADPDTGGVSMIDSDIGKGIHALAFDDTTGALYAGNASNRFFSVDVATGDVTEIDQDTGTAMEAFAFDPATGVLYGGNSAGNFFSIFPGTGEVTMIDSNTGDLIEALAFNSSTGILYAGNSNGRFFSLDTTTGDLTLINNDTGTGIQALAFDDSIGVLYGGNATGRFFTVDPITGDVSIVNVDTGTGMHALEFTEDSGYYWFDDVIPGDYIVREVQQDGWQQTFPTLGVSGIERVSLDSNGIEGNGSSATPSISADGRFVVFKSESSNLVPNDTNGVSDVFIYDRQTDQTQLVTRAANGDSANAPSAGSVSADGHYVVFESRATNLVPGFVPEGQNLIYVWERQTGLIEVVSLNANGDHPNLDSTNPQISADGRYVALQSVATNLLPAPLPDGTPSQIYVIDRQTGQVELLSVNSAGAEGDAPSKSPRISADGRFVTFDSLATNLVNDDTNGSADVFVYDRLTRQLERVSVNADGDEGDGQSTGATVSADGRYVAFESTAKNLIPGEVDENNFFDVFVRDRDTGEVERVSVSSESIKGNLDSFSGRISDDGRFVAFKSDASNLVLGDTNNKTDVFVFDRQNGRIERVSVDADGNQSNDTSEGHFLSSDGRFLVFHSLATNLVSDDSNSVRDVFFVERGLGSYGVSLNPGETLTNLDFGNQRVLSTIHGQKFNDLDGDGVRDAGEPGLDGWTIELVDAASGQVIDTQVTMTMNGEPGWYWFDDVLPGDYIVREVQQDNWQQTLPIRTAQLERAIFSPNPGVGDFFGADSVAVVGTNLVVGAIFEDAGATDAGAVYLFDAATGGLLQTFLDPTPGDFEQFGSSVAPFGNNVLVGAPHDDAAGNGTGAVFLFDSSNGNLLRTFLNPTPANEDNFGRAVAAVGNNVLVGDSGDDTFGHDSGAAYLLDGTTGNLLQTFFHPTPTVLDGFGSVVTAFGEDVLIGTPNDDTGALNAGAVYMYDASTGSLLRTFVNPTPEENEFFGSSIVAFGNNILIGAWNADDAGTDSGAVYLFDGTTGDLLQTFLNPTPEPLDAFGISVAVVGSNVLIGAQNDNMGATSAGTAYLFDTASGDLLRTFLNPTPEENDSFGNSLAASASSVVIGAPRDDTANTDAGAVYLFDSQATFPGTYRVTLGAGDILEGVDFGNQQIGGGSGEIHGLKWHDYNGDGERDPGEPGIPRWTVFIDENGDGILNQGELAVETMDDDPGTPEDETGMYWITGLAAGQYRVAEVVQVGWEQTFPGGDGSYVVDLAANEIVENVDFGNRYARGSIHGSKWLDADGNGQRGANEVGIVDWTITLSGVDAAGNPVNRTTTTMPDDPVTINVDETGMYWFDDLPPGFYTVGEVIPGDDWVQTFPGGNGTHLVAIFPGDVREGIDFGNMQQAQTGSIHGQKFEDIDGDGIRDPGEPGLDGWTIELVNAATGQVVDTQVTMTMNGEPGWYWFDDVAAGDYIVREVLQPGWVATLPASGEQPVTVSAGEIIDGIDFGNTVPGSIHGFKFEDVDGNGQFDADVDHPLAGVRFRVTGTTSQGVAIDLLADLPTLQMYWAEDAPQKIKRANSDGSAVEVLVDTGLARPSGVALDLAEGKMYWTDFVNDKIQRANLDGTGVEDLVITGLDIPRDIALDLANGKMYWADQGTKKIQRANLDGTGVEDLITTGLIAPKGIALDLTAGRIYWAEGGAEKIQRANLDGTSIEDLVTNGLDAPFDVALDLVNEKVYWTDSATAKIQRADLDGTNVEDLISVGLASPKGLALDVVGGKMYWGDGVTDKIQRANLDGTGIEDLVTALAQDPEFIALDLSMAGTNEQGEFWQESLLPGDYTVTEIVADGFVTTTDTTFSVTIASREEYVWRDGAAMLPANDLRYEVNVGSELMFGNTVLGSIHGYKFLDLDSSGTDDGEPQLAGVVITLEGDVDGDGQTDTLQMPTNQDGDYWFDDLFPGPYTITETVPGGFQATTDNPVVVQLLSRQELVAELGQAMDLNELQTEVLDGRLAFGNADIVPPVIEQPGDIVAEATGPDGAVVDFELPTATDNVEVAAVVAVPPSGSLFPLGDTTVTVTATDTSGNAAQVVFTVTVVDTTPPLLELPADLMVEATGPDGAVVVYPPIVATDVVDQDVEIVAVPPSGSLFPLGETVVDVTATDDFGNQAAGQFKVTVVDTTPPLLELPADLVVEATGPNGAIVVYPPIVATDIVDQDVEIVANPPSGSLFPLGATVVDVTATDDAGNQATGQFTVTVVDTTPPLLEVPADLVVEATGPNGAIVVYPPIVATDIVDQDVEVVANPPSGSLFPLGPTVVDVTATDDAGNQTTGQFTVTVVDTTPPLLELPTDLVVEATGPDGAIVVYPPIVATDIVDQDVEIVANPLSGSLFPLGATVVDVTATDDADNQTAGQFTVTVVDTTPPLPELPADLVVEATGPDGAIVVYPPIVATDIVDQDVEIVVNPPSGSLFPIGSTIVNVTATDDFGNQTNGQFTVTVQPIVIIIDDGDPGFSAPKFTRFGPPTNPAQGYQDDLHYHARAVQGVAVATWTFNSLAAGTYQVAITWTAHSNRSNDSTFTVTGTTNNGTAHVNQRLAPSAFPGSFEDDGVYWAPLNIGGSGGNFTLTGSTLTVKLGTSVYGFVIADAVRIERLQSSTPSQQVTALQRLSTASEFAGPATPPALQLAASASDRVFADLGGVPVTVGHDAFRPTDVRREDQLRNIRSLQRTAAVYLETRRGRDLDDEDDALVADIAEARARGLDEASADRLFADLLDDVAIGGDGD